MTAIERDRQVHRAYTVINAQLENPSTGRKMNDATKRKLVLFFYHLSGIQAQDNYSYFAPDYDKRIELRKGDIRKSWQMIANDLGISAKTCMRMSAILVKLGLLKIEHEELTGKKVYAGMQSLKIIRLRTWSAEEEQQAEMAVEDLIVKVNRIILACTEPEMAEIYAENENSENPSVFVPQVSLPIRNNNTGNVLVGQKLISPAIGEDWRVQIVEGRVSADRKFLPRDEVPEEYDGEYYATWVGEKADMFYSPWVVWDVDGDETKIEETLALTRDFVTNLLEYVPSEALRVVFSTRKGFHVYLDSRCVDLKPSDALHEQLKRFCTKLLPECDKSLYSRNRIIGVPNSKHRETGLYYCPLTIDEFFELSVAEMRTAARGPQEFEERAEDMPEVSHLSRIFHEQKPVERTGFSGLETIKQTLMQGHPARRGVKKGGRDQAMFDLALYYKRLGLPIYDVYLLVLDANEHNEPNLPRDTIRKKVNSVFAKEGVTIA